MIVNSSKMNFAEVVNDIMLHYSAEVAEATYQVVPEVAKEAAKKLRKTKWKSGKGDYPKSWTTKIEKGRMQTLATVYAKDPGFRLAHLLEYGHVMRNGKRKSVSGIEHIKPVEEWAIAEAEERIVTKLEREMR